MLQRPGPGPAVDGISGEEAGRILGIRELSVSAWSTRACCPGGPRAAIRARPADVERSPSSASATRTPTGAPAVTPRRSSASTSPACSARRRGPRPGGAAHRPLVLPPPPAGGHRRAPEAQALRSHRPSTSAQPAPPPSRTNQTPTAGLGAVVAVARAASSTRTRRRRPARAAAPRSPRVSTSSPLEQVAVLRARVAHQPPVAGRGAARRVGDQQEVDRARPGTWPSRSQVTPGVQGESLALARACATGPDRVGTDGGAGVLRARAALGMPVAGHRRSGPRPATPSAVVMA